MAPYTSLSPQLHSTANSVMEFCTAEWGIPKKKVRVECAVDETIKYTPTMSAISSESYLLGIDVSTKAYNSTLDSVVLAYRNAAVPIKLYTAVPKDGTEGEFRTHLNIARANGVGVLEVDSDGSVTVVHEASAQSLTGARVPAPKDFPAKYRHAVSEARRLYSSGSPSKACSVIYDEVEDLTKKLYKRARTKACWRDLPAGKTLPSARPTGSWASVAKALTSHLNGTALGCPGLQMPLLARVLGVTQYRNESGHKPQTVAARKKRDRELRTRFEGAFDLLLDMIAATKPLKL